MAESFLRKRAIGKDYPLTAGEYEALRQVAALARMVFLLRVIASSTAGDTFNPQLEELAALERELEAND
jgi:hypothetical protein